MGNARKWIVYLGPDESIVVEWRPENALYEFVRGEKEGDPGEPVDCPAALADQLLQMKFREWPDGVDEETGERKIKLVEVPMHDARNYGAKHFKEADGPGGAKAASGTDRVTLGGVPSGGDD